MKMTVNVIKNTNEKAYSKIANEVLTVLNVGDTVCTSSVEEYFMNTPLACGRMQIAVILALLGEMGFFTVTYAETQEKCGVVKTYTRTEKVNDIF